LAAAVDAGRTLIATRFPDPSHRGAAAMLLGDGTIVTGTSPDAINASVSVCHEIEPYCAAFLGGGTDLDNECPLCGHHHREFEKRLGK
jgi:hypothetical protein